MRESDMRIGEVYLQPGEMFLAQQPTIIRTLLGSCVGIAFWAREHGIGALCHAMLPRCPETLPAEADLLSRYRYVDFAIRDIGRKLDVFGVVRPDVEVKVFGGADVLLEHGDYSSRDTVGSMNVQTAMRVLSEEGFRVTASSLRGATGVNILFNTGNGEVLLRRLKHEDETPRKRKKRSGGIHEDK